VTRSLTGAVWNAKSGRLPRTVKQQLQDLLDEHRPAFLLGSEFNGYIPQLSTLDGWRLAIHHLSGTAILVRDDIEAKFANTFRLGTTPWPYRINSARPVRLHPPRGGCKAIIDGWLDAVSIHMVPDPDHSPVRTRAYNQGIRRLTAYADDRPARPLLIGGDWNKPARKTGPNTPRQLADRIGAEVTYEPGDVLYVLNRKCDVDHVRTIDGAGGSDHALFLFTVTRKATS